MNEEKLLPEENLKVFHALDHPVRLEILAFIYDKTKDQFQDSNNEATVK